MLRMLIFGSAFTAMTGFGMNMSRSGFGLPSQLQKPISVRQSSVSAATYFAAGRLHSRGGFHGGK
ncbi:hypothetical protein KAI87_10270 [Myxococcota bacterium]|nr:hypothetical protein [Myxococcota bacterium]